MLSAIISTRDSERGLVRTLSALVPAVTTGVLREVIVADGGSKDETARVAEIAGCEFLTSNAALGARLAQAVRRAKSSWLLFLKAGVVMLDPAWIDVTGHFIEQTTAAGAPHAAAFRISPIGVLDSISRLFPRRPTPDQGLLIARTHYEALGGHRGGDDAESELIGRIGHRRIIELPTYVIPPGRHFCPVIKP